VTRNVSRFFARDPFMFVEYNLQLNYQPGFNPTNCYVYNTTTCRYTQSILYVCESLPVY
jgi:hypothetical protein